MDRALGLIGFVELPEDRLDLGVTSSNVVEPAASVTNSGCGFFLRSRRRALVIMASSKKRDQGFALDQRGKEVKIKDLTFWPTGNREG
jgi:hypothetical protein